MLDAAAFGGLVTLTGNSMASEAGQIVDGVDFLAESSLFVQVTPSLPKLKPTRLAGRETRLLLHRLTLYDCRAEVIITRKPSKLRAC